MINIFKRLRPVLSRRLGPVWSKKRIPFPSFEASFPTICLGDCRACRASFFFLFSVSGRKKVWGGANPGTESAGRPGRSQAGVARLARASFFFLFRVPLSRRRHVLSCARFVCDRPESGGFGGVRVLSCARFAEIAIPQANLRVWSFHYSPPAHRGFKELFYVLGPFYSGPQGFVLFRQNSVKKEKIIICRGLPRGGLRPPAQGRVRENPEIWQKPGRISAKSWAKCRP